MTIAIYIRVSTYDQNLASQRREITRWLESNGVASDSVVWHEDRASGTSLVRPAFERLQRDVFAGIVKTVVVYKLDRLSRSVRDGIVTLSDWCERGLRVVSVTQQLDFSGATGKLIASVLFAVAEMEMETRRERQAAGIAAAKERGVYRGRQQGATKAGIDPSRAVELRSKGLTYSEISTALGVSVSSVRRYVGAI